MKAPWPKLSTSISPNTSVSPEAMMKIIMPMARLATVSVAHELPEPISGITAIARITGSSTGRKSRFGFGSASVAARSVIDAPPG